VNNLHVNGELTAVVVDDQDTDGTTASLKSLGETAPEIGLVNDRDSLLDITSLGHGDNYQEFVSASRQNMTGDDLPVPFWRSSTRYCLKTGPSMVWTTTLGLGFEMKADSSCNCLVKRSTPKYLC
jgi:hypothetical protein